MLNPKVAGALRVTAQPMPWAPKPLPPTHRGWQHVQERTWPGDTGPAAHAQRAAQPHAPSPGKCLSIPLPRVPLLRAPSVHAEPPSPMNPDYGQGVRGLVQTAADGRNVASSDIDWE